MSGTSPLLTAASLLTADQIQAVEDLVADATRADGVPPLREEVLLQIRAGESGLSILARDQAASPRSALLGFAHRDDATQADGPAVEIAVHPDARHRGIGTALLDEVLRHCPPPPGPVRLWAHGQNAAAGQLAGARGFVRVRHLHQMRRSLLAPLPPVAPPHQVAIRAFDPGHDVGALQGLNAVAFTALPDQGGWSEADIRLRMAEEWFDPNGLLVAESEGRLLGFHWTKIAKPGAAVVTSFGEVYVVGVRPGSRGIGLGRALTLAGLHHLRAAGMDEALLYVDATNVAAIRLYTSLGFSVWDSDMLFRR